MIESLNVNFWKVLSSAVTASTTCLQLKYVKIVKDVAQCANSYKEVCTRVTDVINKCEWNSENRNFTMSDEINDMLPTSRSQGGCLQYDENHSIVLTGIPPKSVSERNHKFFTIFQVESIFFVFFDKYQWYGLCLGPSNNLGGHI